LSQKDLQFRQPFFGRVLILETGIPFDLLDKGMERRIAEEGGALVLHSGVRLGLHTVEQPSHKPRLTDPSFARQERRLTPTVADLLPTARENSKLFGSSDKGGATRATSLKAALDRPGAKNPPSSDWCRKPLEILQPEIRKLEFASEEPPG
jgi:hypothetical protein